MLMALSLAPRGALLAPRLPSSKAQASGQGNPSQLLSSKYKRTTFVKRNYYSLESTVGDTDVKPPFQLSQWSQDNYR